MSLSTFIKLMVLEEMHRFSISPLSLAVICTGNMSNTEGATLTRCDIFGEREHNKKKRDKKKSKKKNDSG